MFKKIDEIFENIKKIFIKNQSSTFLVEKAYAYAKELHKTQVRKDGTPYLGHPVEVAYILAKRGFDEDVVSAGLLHDVVEDCDCTIEQITQMFNENVAELVNSVSAIDKAKYIYDEDDIYESEDFEKASIEEQSFKKLISIGKKNSLGFCIKFADRLHNLSTIDCFPYNKQLEKLKETEKWIIPIAKILNAYYFFHKIKNECFKIRNRNSGQVFFESYNEYHLNNKHNVQTFISYFNEAFSNTKIKQIELAEVEEFKVFDYLKEKAPNINIANLSAGHIMGVQNYRIYLLYENMGKKEANDEVMRVLNSRLASRLKIIDANIGSFTQKPYLVAKDEHENLYNIYTMSLAEYTILQNGTLDGQLNEFIDDDNLDKLEVELIRVKTRSGETMYIPNGSTALDFAFKIHKNIGLGFKYAIINKSKTKSPPYTKLYEDDQVEIVIEKNEDGEIFANPQIKWFAYVNTDHAKKVLIKWFEKRQK